MIFATPPMGQDLLQIAIEHYRAGRLAEAEAIYRQVLAENPNDADTHNNLGAVLRAAGRFDEAIESYRRAIQFKPDRPEGHYNLGNALKFKNQLDEAVECYQRAIDLKGDFSDAYNNLANVLAEQGRIDQAIAASRSAIRLKPDNPDYYVNLLYALYHHPEYDSRRILEETRQWSRRQGGGGATHFPARDRTRRRLKIGYLSPFFGMCADAHYILPLLAHHDRKQFEIFSYTRTIRDDELTARLRPHCQHWHDLRRLRVAESAELIRGHGIDILVNISRPADVCQRIMANRLAPIQITWLTFASCTTGLETMDWRISDPYLDPAGSDECYAEKTLRLPRTAWCYDPLVDSPPVNPLPALAGGGLTFGSLNRLSKINPSVVAAWAQILRAVPNSRMLILAIPGSHRQRLLDQFHQGSVDAGRIEFIDRQSRIDYLKQYGRIDVTLDPFPFSGHTTTLDSLWMGVPVVTLSGGTCVGRASASALHNLGMAEWIAQTPSQYVSLAVQFSKDVEKLAQVRAGLRQRMRQSALTDASRFALHMEEAYRQVWRQFLDGAQTPQSAD